MSNDREQGVEFGDLMPELEAEDYPIQKTEFIDRYGDRRVDHAGGSTRLGPLLEPLGLEAFESADEVRHATVTMIGQEAEGRTEYSDRGTAEAERQRDQESF